MIGNDHIPLDREKMKKGTCMVDKVIYNHQV